MQTICRNGDQTSRWHSLPRICPLIAVSAFHGYGFEEIRHAVGRDFQVALDSLPFCMRFPNLETFQKPVESEYNDPYGLDKEYERPLSRIGLEK